MTMIASRIIRIIGLCCLTFPVAAQEAVIPVQLVAVNYTTLSAELPAKIDRIARIGAKVDAVSHSVKVTAEIRGDFPELMAGMTGRAQMTAP